MSQRSGSLTSGFALLALALTIVSTSVSGAHPGAERPRSDDRPPGTATAAGNLTQDAQIELTNQGYTSVEGIAVGDVDNDGKNELVANYDWYLNPGPARTVWYEKNGSSWDYDGGIDNFTMLLSPGLIVQGLAHIVVGDADNDGANELLIPGKYRGTDGVYLFRVNGANSTIAWSGSGKDGEIGDVDGDGKNELLVPGQGVLKWNGTGFAKVADLAGNDGIRLGDVNGNGRTDVVLPSGTLGVVVYEWQSGQMVEIGRGTDSGYIMSGIGVGDADGDGRDEAFVVEYHNKMALYGWDGSKIVQEWNGTFWSSDSATDAWVADVDGDGLAELFAGGGNSAGGITVTQWEFNGTGYDDTWNSGALQLYCHSIEHGDVDNDGLPELVVGSGSNGRAWVFSAQNETPGPPGAPRLLAASSGDSRTDLSWSPPLSTGGSAVANYRIYRGTSSGEAQFLAEIGTTTVFADSGLTNGVQYYYQVSAKNAVGDGPRSSEVSATPGRQPSVPRNAVATGGDSRIDVSWDPPSDAGGLLLQGYRLHRGTSSGQYPVTRDIGPAVTTFADYPLATGTTYYYTVSAWNTIGEGPMSAEASATTDSGPAAPVVSGFAPAGPTGTLLTTQGHVSFSEEMDPQTTIGAFSLTPSIPLSFEVNRNVLYWNHSMLFAPSTMYTFSVSTSAKSKAGAALVAPFSHSFNTTDKGVVPLIVTIDPPDGATGVGTDVAVRLTFSKPMDAFSVFRALSISPKPNFAGGFDADSRVLTLSFTSALESGTTYTVTVEGTAAAKDGISLGATFTSRFTTGGSPPLISGSTWGTIIPFMVVALLAAFLVIIPIYYWRSRRAQTALAAPLPGVALPSHAAVAKAVKFRTFESTVGLIFVSGLVAFGLTALILFLAGFLLGGALGMNLSAMATPGVAYGLCFLIWFILGGLALYGSRLQRKESALAGAPLPPPPSPFLPPTPPPPHGSFVRTFPPPVTDTRPGPPPPPSLRRRP